jgi:hypothetical protein
VLDPFRTEFYNNVLFFSFPLRRFFYTVRNKIYQYDVGGENIEILNWMLKRTKKKYSKCYLSLFFLYAVGYYRVNPQIEKKSRNLFNTYRGFKKEFVKYFDNEIDLRL